MGFHFNVVIDKLLILEVLKLWRNLFVVGTQSREGQSLTLIYYHLSILRGKSW